MKLNDVIRLFVSFAIYFLLQIFWAKDFVMYQVAFCFLYIGFLASLPLNLPIPALLLISFVTGIFFDLFYDTLGIHAAACVAALYARSYLMALLTPLGGYDNSTEISISAMGISWYIVYTVIIIFVHHFILFTIEAGGFMYFQWTILKVIASTIFSSFIIISLQYLFLSGNRNGR